MPFSADLVVNLNAIAHNWLLMQAKLDRNVDCGAVVKANAYGLGMTSVVRALAKVGCRRFYVANLQEALVLREHLNILVQEFSLLPGACEIVVLSGCARGEELAFIEHRLVPVLISEEMLGRWLGVLRRAGVRAGSVGSVLKVDTGMGRLGLEPEEFKRLLADKGALLDSGVSMLMSHLACADDERSEHNELQLGAFRECYEQLKYVLPACGASLANSAGVLLGRRYHFDGVRPGVALYGGNPQPIKDNMLKPSVSLALPVIQLRSLPEGGCVGYGATARFDRAARLAIVAGGYADGLFRSLSNRGECWVPSGGRSAGEGWRVPIVGRVSMDTTIVDISSVPEGAVCVGDRLEFIGEHITLDEIAIKAGTISYEVLTSLGSRYQRGYTG